MRAEPRPRGSELSPEPPATTEAIRSASRTPKSRAGRAAVPVEEAGGPRLGELVRPGELTPERVFVMGALGALVNAMAEIRRVRAAKGLSLSEVSRRSGLSLSVLSRLESGKNARPTVRTLARYAGAVGLEVDLILREGRKT